MRRRRYLVYAILTLALLLSACGSLGTPAVDDIVARLQESQEHPQPVHLLAEMTFSTPDGQTQRLLLEQWLAPNGKMRMEYKEGPPEVEGTLLVSDGTTMWMYMPESKRYMKMNLSQFQAQRPSPEGMSAQLRDLVQQALDTMSFTYLGTEEVAGRKAYKLRAKPKAGMEDKSPFGGGEVTLWVDTERWEVLGMESRAEGMGFGWKVKEIEYEVEIPDDLFTFTPPPDAQPLGGEGKAQVMMPGQMLTLEEAQQAVDFEILVPQDLPEDFRLIGVQVMEPPGMKGEAVGKVVTLLYQRGVQMLTISEMPVPAGMPEGADISPMPGAEGERVTVRGHRATLMEMGLGGRTLVWQEEGVIITITGQVDKEMLLRVAEGMK